MGAGRWVRGWRWIFGVEGVVVPGEESLGTFRSVPDSGLSDTLDVARPCRWHHQWTGSEQRLDRGVQMGGTSR